MTETSEKTLVMESDSEPTYFARLGLPIGYFIDLSDLERRYLAASRDLHPDFHQLASAEEQQQSLEASAALNEAYHILKDPFRRADYLLSLYGGPAASELREMPEDFLEEVLELRMEIEELKESGATESPQAQELENRLENERAQVMERIEQLFANHQAKTDDKPNAQRPILEEIRRRLNTVKYLDGLLRDLAE